MTKKTRRVSAIEILQPRAYGASAGRLASVQTKRTGRLTKRGKAVNQGSGFGASFDVDPPGYTVTIDSRLVLRDCAEAMHGRLIDGLKNDKDPSTGRSHPKNARITPRIRKLMLKSLKRTFTDSRARWGGGYKRLSNPVSTVKFYFADKEAAGINKSQYSRKGKDKVVRLHVRGASGDDIARGLAHHAKRVVDGDIIERDTKSRTRRAKR